MEDNGAVFDYEGLRHDLLEYYATASKLGFPLSLVEVDLKRVREASNDELLEIADQEDIATDGYWIG